MSKIPLARKFFFQELKSEQETEIVYCGNRVAKTFHTELHLKERVSRPHCQVRVVYFVSHRSMVSKILIVYLQVFSKIHSIGRVQYVLSKPLQTDNNLFH